MLTVSEHSKVSKVIKNSVLSSHRRRGCSVKKPLASGLIVQLFDTKTMQDTPNCQGATPRRTEDARLQGCRVVGL